MVDPKDKCVHMDNGKCTTCQNLEELQEEQKGLLRSIAELKDLREYAKEERVFAEKRAAEIKEHMCTTCLRTWNEKQVDKKREKEKAKQG